MGARRSTQSSARKRHYKRRLRRAVVLVVVALVLAVLVCGGLAYPVLAPDLNLRISSDTTITPLSPELPIIQAPEKVQPLETPEPTYRPAMVLPTQGQIVPPSQDPQILYYTIAGDSLEVVSLRFGVNIDEISSPEPLERKGLLPPGQLLIIPNNLTETSSTNKLLPDSEVVFSPSTIDFDIEAFVNEAGGYLSNYHEYLMSTGVTSGAEIIQRIALEYSINPRLLLAFLEFKSGWVYGLPADESAVKYPMGYEDKVREGLYFQCAWFASRVMDGYFGWREGRTLVITFLDGQVLRLAPQLNAGTVGLMNAFTYLYEFEEWAHLLYGERSFLTFHKEMFGNPWIRAQTVEPLIPVDTVQPEMILPFEFNDLWAFTGGPHAAWSAADVWAALDFAPASGSTGCFVSDSWVVAAMSGLIVRSENGVVVIDLDEDGYEQTGWTLLYLHIADKDRIALGTRVDVGDRIGHASCEGGRSTGTHIHLARRYNGEWVPADGPLPFTLDGWVAKAGTKAYEGWLIKGDQILYANTSSTYETQLMREE